MGKTIVGIEIVEAEKRRTPSKHYVYVLVVKWSDGSCFKIFRRYSRFFDLQTVLLDSFPIEGGTLDPSKRIIPFLPGKIFFGRSHIKDVAMKRLGELNSYCKSLVALPTRISNCEHVLEFFEVEPDDLDPPMADETDSKKGSSNKEPKADKISSPKRLECFVVVAEYQAQAPGELTLFPGTKVEVLEKNDIGWWFVNSEDEQGWVPSSYLEPESGAPAVNIRKAEPGKEEVFVCIEDFHSTHQDEVSLEKGVAVAVIQKNMDGWWLVRYQGREAYAPGTYLKKASNATRTSMVEKSRLSGVQIVSSLQDVSTIMKTEAKSKSEEPSGADKSKKQGIASTILKQSSLERGGSLKPPPRQNSITKTKVKPTAQKSSVYVTIDDFTSTVGDGLSFHKGKTVHVVEKNSSGWWLVQLGSEEGWVPASYLESSSSTSEMPSVYEMASSEDLSDVYEFDHADDDDEFDDSDSDSVNDNELYTEPDDLPQARHSSAMAKSVTHPTKRPLPEIPTESESSEKPGNTANSKSRPLPPVPSEESKTTNDTQSNSSMLKKPNPPALPKNDPPLERDEKRSVGNKGAPDLASVLKAKFESRSGGAGSREKVVADKDSALRQSKPIVPSPALLGKPSDIKKLQSQGSKPMFVSESKERTSNQSQGDNTKVFGKPAVPVKAKSPISFEKNSENAQTANQNGLPKVVLKPVLGKERSPESKPQDNRNDVKRLAAGLVKPITNPPSRPPTTPPKPPVASKPQVASKPKPSVPSKPPLAAKPKPGVKPKVNQNVNSIASALDNKLNFTKPMSVEESDKGNDSRNNTDDCIEHKGTQGLRDQMPPKIAGKKKVQSFVAVCEFQGEADGELSLREGDVVEMLEDNGDWAFVEMWEEQGWVPTSYLEEC